MGDVGSLSLGGAIGMLAVLTKNELILLIVSGLFVVEAMSVMIQVIRYKLRKKRILQDGADPPPLRAQGLARTEDHRAV